MQQLEALKKKRAFKKVTYRGIDLDKLLDLPLLKAVELLPARIRRRFDRGLKRKHTTLLRKIRKAKKECKPLEKPATVKTHLRNMPILPEMVSPRRSGRPFWSGAAHLEHAPPWVRHGPASPHFALPRSRLRRAGRRCGCNLQRQGVQRG